jgi:hypothetical protein
MGQFTKRKFFVAMENTTKSVCDKKETKKSFPIQKDVKKKSAQFS